MTPFGHVAQAGARNDDVEARFSALEDQIDRLHAELEVLKAQSTLVVQRTHLGYVDKTYGKFGFSLILPRGRTFTSKTDTGLGFSFGAGRYFGRSHVVDAAFEWDLYPSAALRYRYEFHADGTSLTFAPVGGVKVKVFDAKPIDTFLEKPQDVRSVFFFLGFLVGIPLPHSMATLETLYLFNSQQIVMTNFALHLFL